MFAGLLLLSCSSVCDNTVNGLPLHVERLSDNAIRMWVGDYVSSTAVSALNTEKGIVVIDTTEIPELDQRFREVIAKEFGRDDFTHLINTHEHGDHTTGNGIYSDCEIVAHELCADGMRAQLENRQRALDWYEEFIPQVEAELAEMEEGTDEYAQKHEDLVVRKMRRASLEAGIEPTFPTRTFQDSMTIDMGDMTLELYAVGGTHTPSDIFVFVPEEGLLFTGDMMADEWFTDTPGCLQAFSLRQGMQRDIPLTLKNWNALIARKDEIRDFVPGHWNGDLSHDGFVDRYNYLETLYTEVAAAAQAGGRLDDLLAELDMEARFPHLRGTPGFAADWIHQGSVVALWADATGARTAGDVLAGMIEEQGLEAAIAEIVADREQGSKQYILLENEINQLGYRFMNEEKFDEAIAVLQLNVDAFPESWNVYDSLGEAYWKSGQLDLATSLYTRSLEINPESESGRNALAEIGTVVARE
jgi:glyoxylase-like metal-dependent hydrolase (beta-lactamase superfamily II)